MREPRDLLVRAGAFAAILLVLLLPLPWVPDAYVAVMSRATNAVLTLADAATGYRIRLEPPSTIRSEGSWKAPLDVEALESGQHVRLKVDMRTFSYRPFATFVALAAVTPARARRRRLALWAGGGICMLLATTAFASLPLLERFALWGAFGGAMTALVRTAYQALSTPVMVYALPALLWWLWVSRSRDVQPAH